MYILPGKTISKVFILAPAAGYHMDADVIDWIDDAVSGQSVDIICRHQSTSSVNIIGLITLNLDWLICGQHQAGYIIVCEADNRSLNLLISQPFIMLNLVQFVASNGYCMYSILGHLFWAFSRKDMLLCNKVSFGKKCTVDVRGICTCAHLILSIPCVLIFYFNGTR